MSLKTRWAAAVLALMTTFPAAADTPLDFEILDRKTGQVLPVFWHEGERYVAGEPGREYEIRLRNRSGARLLAVTSVDGVNVITGGSASPRQSGYVLDPWGLVEIDGWRKSLDEVAAFYFTRLPDSYAARTGRPDNVGVIGVALFRERERPMPLEDYLARPEASAGAAAPSAESRSATRESRRLDAEESRLGTGHGRRLDSGAVYTHFERASEEPDAVICIFYDSRKNLVAQGVIPQAYDRMARRQPEAFPQGFVPDP